MGEFVFEAILVTEGAPGQRATESGVNTTPIIAPAGIQTTPASAPIPGTWVAPGTASNTALNAAGREARLNSLVAELLVFAREQCERVFAGDNCMESPLYACGLKNRYEGVILRMPPNNWCQTCLSQACEAVVFDEKPWEKPWIP
jgi:hypothetical protein